MFVTDDRSQMSWFQAKSLEPLYKFELLGLLTSLAVYNGLTLPFTFPLALYRELLGISNTPLELRDGWPALFQGLMNLMSWDDGDVKDVFMRSYVFSVPTPGSTWSVAMNPKGFPSPLEFEDGEEPIMVTNENRRKYVKDYTWWLLYGSIKEQYEAFEKGFYHCIDREALSSFDPFSLKLLVEGSSDIDVDGLEKATRYDGYTVEDETIKNFWHVVRSLSPEQLRKLLEFVTASDRVPFGGIETIDFMIQENGMGDDDVGFFNYVGNTLLTLSSGCPVARRALVGCCCLNTQVGRKCRRSFVSQSRTVKDSAIISHLREIRKVNAHQRSGSVVLLIPMYNY